MEVIEAVVSDEDSNDSEMNNMKSQLNEFGLDDENLSKEEMINLLKALNESKETAKEDELLRQTVDDKSTSPNMPKMKRRYLTVRDRRMPWCLLPMQLTQSQRARILAVYLKYMAISRHRQARQAIKFAVWSAPIQIIEESTTRIQPCRSTRRDRVIPMYMEVEDDSSDLDFVVSHTKRKKIVEAEDEVGGIYSNKCLSLKRKAENNTKTQQDFDCEASTSSSKIIKRDFVIDED